uniref:AlNc14C45G3660 protein n=1 Tax=Albugo laibachii Nc14 TaxID=890382 RepID=F0WAD0_9STRA|nr:AlNc14C45G3660 [Albugo laibachii Nc14]|eukprot:CCA18101.1 AlNc14C45G3660 [Albugo laibachii Nc14]
MSQYSKSTLNGNWFEDRASRLNGVLPLNDAKDSQRAYSTTTKSEYKGEQNARVNQKARLINAGNTHLAQDKNCDYSEDVPADAQILLSTYQESYGISRFNKADRAYMPNNIGTKLNEATPLAEKFQIGKDAAGCTPAQASRSSHKDNRHYHMQNETSYILSLPRYGKRLTGITGVPSGHQGVFVDD